MLGLYHRLVKDFHPEWDPPHGHYHNARHVLQSFQKMGERLISMPRIKGHESELIEVLRLLREAYKTAARIVDDLGISQWETQIVHSDWHPGNMLFEKGHVAAVIDFDAARIAPRVIDIANGTLQFSFTSGGRDLAAWEGRADDLRARRFLRGYDEMIVITHAELTAMPHLMQEAVIAQVVGPILRTGTFAGLDAFDFLRVVLRKVQWLQQNAESISLPTDE
jgi:homoserine kinase type II